MQSGTRLIHVLGFVMSCGVLAFLVGACAAYPGQSPGVQPPTEPIVASEVVETGDEPDLADGAINRVGSASVSYDEFDAMDDAPPTVGDPPDRGDRVLSPDGVLVPDALTINGVYSLGLEGRSFSFLHGYLNNPDLDGFSLRAKWHEVEPEEGLYDWSMFDSVIEHAAAYGKKVMLRVLPGVHAPQWVYDAGATQFEFVDENPYHPTYGQTLHTPVPWDPVYLSKWLALVDAFGERYSRNQAVVIVSVTGPAFGGEMHLAAKNDADNWHDAGYSNSVLIDAWQQTIDAYRAAFPRTHLTVAIATPVNFDSPMDVVGAVIEYCSLRKVGIQGNWLAAKTPPTFRLYQEVATYSGAPVGFQMLCSAAQGRFGGTLYTAVDRSLEANASFLELYKIDFTRYPEDVAYAHDELTLE